MSRNEEMQSNKSTGPCRRLPEGCTSTTVPGPVAADGVISSVETTVEVVVKLKDVVAIEDARTVDDPFAENFARRESYHIITMSTEYNKYDPLVRHCCALTK